MATTYGARAVLVGTGATVAGVGTYHWNAKTGKYDGKDENGNEIPLHNTNTPQTATPLNLSQSVEIKKD